MTEVKKHIHFSVQLPVNNRAERANPGNNTINRIARYPHGFEV